MPYNPDEPLQFLDDLNRRAPGAVFVIDPSVLTNDDDENAPKTHVISRPLDLLVSGQDPVAKVLPGGVVLKTPSLGTVKVTSYESDSWIVRVHQLANAQQRDAIMDRAETFVAGSCEFGALARSDADWLLSLLPPEQSRSDIANTPQAAQGGGRQGSVESQGSGQLGL